MKDTIVVSGANGFLGRYFTRYFSEQKKQVRALIHTTYKAAYKGVEVRQFDLRSFSSDVLPADAGVLIHCAELPLNNDKSIHENIKTTARLLSFARRKNIEQVIFFSSFLSAPESHSLFGKYKYQMEQIFDAEKDLIVRLPLVLGPGGLYKKLEDSVYHSKWFPVLGLSNQEFYTLEIADLMHMVEQFIHERKTGFVNLASEPAMSYKALLQRIAQAKKGKTRFIPVANRPAVALIKMMEKLYGKKSPLTMEEYYQFQQESFNDITFVSSSD